MAEQQRSPILDVVPTGAAEGEVITQNALPQLTKSGESTDIVAASN